MKSTITLSTLLLLSLSLVAAGPVFRPKVNPLRFGEVETGTVVDLTFEFVNAGDATLVIKSIQPTCGCTT
ncbi:MAG TPA: DUF1573 domain-containing protein, partial [Candidatus Aminicenantes bacterium]|nr:DUF1573 domain-containing protein [Candidatus Aminicenantes bacterium]